MQRLLFIVSTIVLANTPLISYPGSLQQPESDPAVQIQPEQNNQHISSIGLSFGNTRRGGDALNTVPPPNEYSSFSLLEIDLLYSMPISQNTRLQFDISHEENDVNQTLGSQVTDDTLVSASLLDVQLGYSDKQKYLGGFVGVGRTKFTDADIDQNTTFRIAGLSTKYNFENWSLGAQIGHISSEATDLETLDDANFVSLIGQYFFSNQKSTLGLRMSYADGSSDNDTGADPTTLTDITIFGEHILDYDIGHTTPSIYGGISYIASRETGSTGISKLNEATIFAGIKFSFGKSSDVSLRNRDIAYKLPEIENWIGHVPTLD